MYSDNLIAVQNSKAKFIGQNTLNFINLQYDPPFGYPSGSIGEGDIFILIIHDPNAMSASEADLIRRLCGNIDMCGCAVIGSCFEEEMGTMVIRSLDASTVFGGVNISFRAGSDDLPLVSIENQHISCSFVNGRFLIIYGKEGVRYFSSGADDLSFDEIMHGARFKGHVQLPPVDSANAVNIEDALDQKFKGLLSGETTIIQGVVSCPETIDQNTSSHIWSIFSADDLLKNAKETFTLYDRILKADEFQIPSSGFSFSLWGKDEKILKVKYLLQKASDTGTTILLTGESGTGKSFLSKQIHNNSSRRCGPFINVNCAAIPYTLIESELFGYEGGAFTGARKSGKTGYFEQANGGTLFLDEISEIPMELQGKLLEAIQSHSFYRVGGERSIVSDVRIIAATNQNLEALVNENRFREDLYYRINVFPVEIPPLRERLDSLFFIISDILPAICSRVGTDQLLVSDKAIRKMKHYSWPGNIRELENVLEKACILSDGKLIRCDDIDIPVDKTYEDIASAIAPNQAGVSAGHRLKDAKELLEKQLIIDALEQFGGEKQKTAEYLGIGRTSLFDKINKYGIDCRSFHEGESGK